MSIQKFYKILNPGYATTGMASSADVIGFGSINWYTRLVRGSYTRLKRYSEYDTMDADVDVARALDLIAEEMVGNKGDFHHNTRSGSMAPQRWVINRCSSLTKLIPGEHIGKSFEIIVIPIPHFLFQPPFGGDSPAS